MKKETLVIADNLEPIDNVTLASSWYGFRTAALPVTASPAQVADMKAAFYAGVTTMLGVMERIGDPNMPDEVGEATLARIADEAMTFAANLPGG